jgi:hypothetical protein
MNHPSVSYKSIVRRSFKIDIVAGSMLSCWAKLCFHKVAIRAHGSAVSSETGPFSVLSFWPLHVAQNIIRFPLGLICCFSGTKYILQFPSRGRSCLCYPSVYSMSISDVAPYEIACYFHPLFPSSQIMATLSSDSFYPPAGR